MWAGKGGFFFPKAFKVVSIMVSPVFLGIPYVPPLAEIGWSRSCFSWVWLNFSSRLDILGEFASITSTIISTCGVGKPTACQRCVMSACWTFGSALGSVWGASVYFNISNPFSAGSSKLVCRTWLSWKCQLILNPTLPFSTLWSAHTWPLFPVKLLIP